MGLDVYMYALNEGVTKDQLEAARKAHDEATDAFYGREDYDSLTDEQKEAERKRIREEHPDPEGEYLGYDKETLSSRYDHSASLAQQIELPSEKYPDLYSKIGYWRSSYNSGGINSVLRDNGLKDLYWVTFGQEDADEYIVWPEWTEVRDRAKQLIADWDARMEEVGGYQVIEVDSFGTVGMHEPPLSSEQEALDRFLDERKKHEDSPLGGGYSSHRGHFFGDPIEIVAAMPGVKEDILGRFRGDAEAKMPTVYLIAKGGPHESYRQTLEVVLETAEYAIANGPERHYLHWSA